MNEKKQLKGRGKYYLHDSKVETCSINGKNHISPLCTALVCLRWKKPEGQTIDLYKKYREE